MEDDGGPPMEDVLPEDDPFLPFWSELHAVRSSRFSLGITSGIAIDCFFLLLFFLVVCSCCLPADCNSGNEARTQ